MEKSSREARDSLALSQTERAEDIIEDTLPALIIVHLTGALATLTLADFTSHTANLILTSSPIYSNRMLVWLCHRLEFGGEEDNGE